MLRFAEPIHNLSDEQIRDEIGEGLDQTDIILSRFLIDISGTKISSAKQIIGVIGKSKKGSALLGPCLQFEMILYLFYS
jgi:hypothetical protein